jgi:hypothetical protein
MPSTIRLFSKAIPVALLLLLLVTAPTPADASHIQAGTVKIPLPPAVVWVLLTAIGTFLFYMAWSRDLLRRPQTPPGSNGHTETS